MARHRPRHPRDLASSESSDSYYSDSYESPSSDGGSSASSEPRYRPRHRKHHSHHQLRRRSRSERSRPKHGHGSLPEIRSREVRRGAPPSEREGVRDSGPWELGATAAGVPPEEVAGMINWAPPLLNNRPVNKVHNKKKNPVWCCA
eukprot:Gregarina_sp_Poly_1__3352@NODE_1967_length_2975_cov_208_119326_g1267_i0_p4_GENE_NODE_1967_length_2975_cov_208_119326_g1267_i0NODE_1967_length_2975_cov_208_119326_g1267_i0_p4_ORF_typecomplete_len146_score11_57_NODE_1967_length_2975_cov_208_119326_g1267_i019922429